MSENVWFPAYRDARQGTKYPFAEGATLVSRDSLTLPPGLLLDAALYPLDPLPRLGLTAVVIAADHAVTLQFGGGDIPAALGTSYNPFDPPALLPVVVLSSPFLGIPEGVVPDPSQAVPGGLLVADPTVLATLQTWPAGTHAFDPGAAELVPSCGRAVPPAVVQGLRVGGTVVQGDVWLYGQNGVVLEAREVAEAGEFAPPTAIAVHVVGEPYRSRKRCGADPAANPPAATLRQLVVIGHDRRRIAVGPDDQGNFTINVGVHAAADPALRVTPGAGGDPQAIQFTVLGPSSS